MPAYDASLRQRGSLTVWFTDEAIESWQAEPRTTRGGQSRYWGSGSSGTESAFQHLNSQGLLAKDRCTCLCTSMPCIKRVSGKASATRIKRWFSAGTYGPKSLARHQPPSIELSVPLLPDPHILRFGRYALDMGNLPDPLNPQPLPFEPAL